MLLKLKFPYILDISGEAEKILASQKGMRHLELVITFSGVCKFVITLKTVYIYNGICSQSKVIRCDSSRNYKTQLNVFTRRVI